MKTIVMQSIREDHLVLTELETVNKTLSVRARLPVTIFQHHHLHMKGSINRCSHCTLQSFVVNSRAICKPSFFKKFIWRDRTGNLTQEERKYYLVLTTAYSLKEKL